MTIARWLQTRPEVREVISGAAGRARPRAVEARLHWRVGLFGVVLQPVAKERVDAMLDGMRLFGIGWSWGASRA